MKLPTKWSLICLTATYAASVHPGLRHETIVKKPTNHLPPTPTFAPFTISPIYLLL